MLELMVTALPLAHGIVLARATKSSQLRVVAVVASAVLVKVHM